MMHCLNCRNQLITDSAYSFGDQLLNGDAGERSVLVKQHPKAVSHVNTKCQTCVILNM